MGLQRTFKISYLSKHDSVYIRNSGGSVAATLHVCIVRSMYIHTYVCRTIRQGRAVLGEEFHRGPGTRTKKKVMVLHHVPTHAYLLRVLLGSFALNFRAMRTTHSALCMTQPVRVQLWPILHPVRPILHPLRTSQSGALCGAFDDLQGTCRPSLATLRHANCLRATNLLPRLFSVHGSRERTDLRCGEKMTVSEGGAARLVPVRTKTKIQIRGSKNNQRGAAT